MHRFKVLATFALYTEKEKKKKYFVDFVVGISLRKMQRYWQSAKTSTKIAFFPFDNLIQNRKIPFFALHSLKCMIFNRGY